MPTYIKQIINLLKVFLLGLAAFELFRIAFLIRFGESGIVSNYTGEIFIAFITGYRFDTQVLCYALAFPFLITHLHFFKNEKLSNIIIKVSKIYSIIILAIYLLILLIDHQYYTYFQNHINSLVFGFFEDDTSAVMSSVWSDHPVIIIALIYFGAVFLFIKLIKSFYNSSRAMISAPIYIKILIIPITLVLFLLGARGSVGVFPLKMDDSIVSENRFINTLVLNGVFTLEKALEERGENSKTIYRSEVLNKTHYKSIHQVLTDYYGENIKNANQDFNDFLFEETDTNLFLKNNPPNVVFVLMESFGSYYLRFHSKEMNLLGSLENHIREDYFFTNFLSATQGTIYTLENIMINKDYPLLSNSKRRFDKHLSSVALPFKKAGYKTIFITGGKVGWRNLHEFVPNQFFDEVYGKAVIKKNNPEAIDNTWGVYDEYLFDEVYNRLNEDAQPKLIFVLTTTNHTPYELPNSYDSYPLSISDSLNNLIMANKNIAEANFKAYQYANDCLGKFMDKIKGSHLGRKTIVASSGDHNSYALFPLNHSSIKEEDNYKVPFYLFVPEDYRPKDYIYTKRYGSHKDIFPTLINLSLHHQRYFSLGYNLFDLQQPDSLFFGVNLVFNLGHPKLNAETLHQKAYSRHLLNKYYFAKP